MRTTSRSPVLSRRDSPLQGSGQQNNQAGQRNSTRFVSLSMSMPFLCWKEKVLWEARIFFREFLAYLLDVKRTKFLVFHLISHD